MAYDNRNSGVLFRNDKGDNEKRPDYTGKLDVGGTEYRLAGWVREGQKGKFLSLKVTVPEQQSGGGETPDPQAPLDDGDQIPFITPWGIR